MLALVNIQLLGPPGHMNVSCSDDAGGDVQELDWWDSFDMSIKNGV